MATGDFLFDPQKGDHCSRDEDHLAHFIELLGKIPSSIYKKSKYGNKYFDKVFFNINFKIFFCQNRKLVAKILCFMPYRFEINEGE